MATPNQTLIELIEARRIALTPEHGAGWCAEVYGDEDEVQYTGYGLTVDEAITAALSPSARAEDLPHQGIPGTSFQRLNALALQGE
ncbi:hypothetical protein K2E95_00205 [Pseudomonas sp. ERGC3:01]|nr:hypothetical protein [Pseudomonas sp. ERGC3:01]